MWRELKSILFDRQGSGRGGSETPFTDLFWLVFWMMILVVLVILALLIIWAVVGALRGTG